MKDIAKGVAYAGVFAVPFVALIISNSMFFPFITGKNFTFRIIVEIISAAWIVLAFYDAAYRPKFSWILVAFTSLLGIMAVANALGADPHGSFWSNFERMEGYVTLVHTFMYMVVAGSILTTEKLWFRFFNTVIFSAVLVALYAFRQLSGDATINQGGWRLDGTLGNSAYMAIYTLFLVFITLYMFLRAKTQVWRAVYSLLALLFVYLLIQTATRGTILGLMGGLTITTAYIALFSTTYPKMRTYATGGLLTVLVIIGLFVGFRKSEFIQNNPYLARVANITLSEGNVRFKIWDMAYEGLKERPLLGWGQGNFNYIFNEKYDPALYFAESWYDRVHNIVFDWLVAGGILGALAYFSIMAAAFYYLAIRPLMNKSEEQFMVVERGVLIGLLAGYLFHNMFVFDNIVSYMFFAMILAFIHARVARPIAAFAEKKYDSTLIEQVVAPVIGVACIALIYVINIPGIQAATLIIEGFKQTDPTAMLARFDEALEKGSFGNQEIREQMTRQAQSVTGSAEVGEEVKQKFLARIEEELIQQIKDKPGDARIHVFISSFYRMTGQADKAIEQLKIARELSPRKQQIIFEQGLTHLQKEEYAIARDYFKEAYELDTSYTEARIYYAIGAVYADQYGIVDEILTTEGHKNAFAQSDVAIQAVYRAKLYPRIIDMFERRIVINPKDVQARTNLAYILNESGDKGKAIETLQKAAEDMPEFKAQSEEFIKSIIGSVIPTSDSAPQVTVNGQSADVVKP